MNNAVRIRIGTRASELALWQAGLVKESLEELGYSTVIIPIKSTGDIELVTPLYEMGITGIFTKHLDAALLDAKIDIAVHSMKDVPTALPENIVQAAVLERANVHDVLIYRDADNVLTKYDGKVATGSLRRKAQWLNRHPKHEVVGLRGNVNTRLKKLEDSDWNGAIFAKAGLERLGKALDNHMDLDWMVPAPAQGAIMISARQDDEFVLEACAKLNHEDSEICTFVERDFLRTLEGGCTAPIGALATVKHNLLLGGHIDFTGVLLSRDGQKKFEISKTVKLSEAKTLGKECAENIIAQGAKDVMRADAELAAQQMARQALTPVNPAVQKRAEAGAKKKDKTRAVLPKDMEEKSRR
ncbi:MAG: hydroxymethylbilane synthase, partial [Robiginitomaculum sp.]|nr:hydroxymethylbilane synthase [Robiginitomaculum sp.]